MSLRKLFAPALLLLLTSLYAPCARAQSSDARAQAAAEIESLRAQIKAKESVLLAPSGEDRKAYAEFLTQPRTGLVRLLPREKWDSKLSTRGGGAYYSFTLRSHEYGRGTNIGLEQDYLGTGFAGADFGFMSNIGDAPLETLSTADEAVRFAAAYKAPTAEADARAAHRSFWQPGRRDGDFVYMDRLPVSVGSTYVVRSILYEDSDTLVAFRVLRKDSDGSVVLLWKILQEFQKPPLERSVASANGQ
jgi:hypothetical protein